MRIVPTAPELCRPAKPCRLAQDQVPAHKSTQAHQHAMIIQYCLGAALRRAGGFEKGTSPRRDGKYEKGAAPQISAMQCTLLDCIWIE